MTTILAIETSTELASAALLVGEQLYVRELSGVQTHSHGILPALQSLLAEANLTLSACDAIAYGCGPGAFTGIRTACGIVQGLAYGADLPVIPVTSLRAMAQVAFDEQGGADFVCVLDARMEEVYWAQYRYVDQCWQEVVAPVLSRADEVRADGGAQDALYVLGRGVVLSAAAPARQLVDCMPHAAQVARIAALAYAAGVRLAPEQAQPLYLRNKIALTTAERLQVKQTA